MRTKRDGSSVVLTAVAARDWVSDTVFAFWHAAIVVATHASGLGWQLALAGATLILQSVALVVAGVGVGVVFALDSSTSASEAVTLSGFLSVSGCF